MPPQHLTLPVVSSFQAPLVTAWSRRRLHCMEKGNQISPKLLKLEYDDMPGPSDPSSNQWDDGQEPSTSRLSQNCSSIPAANGHADDAGRYGGRGPTHYSISSLPLLGVPHALRALANPPLGWRCREWAAVPGGEQESDAEGWMWMLHPAPCPPSKVAKTKPREEQSSGFSWSKNHSNL